MTKQELNAFREKLVNLRNRLRGNVSDLEEEAFRRTGDSNLSHLPLHPADLGSEDFEQQVAMVLLENEGQTLAETAAALDRIDAATFGRCEECQRDIPLARLEALPYTRHCVECARQLEQEGASVGRW